MSTSAHTWRFLLSPPEAWEAMYEDCFRATKSIEFEQYILENDPVGNRFLDLFIEKAKQGVKVFLICDGFGSFDLNGSERVENLRKAGGSFYFYHPVKTYNLLTPWAWFPRTHIKTLLIDSEIAYTGGVCIAERMKDWRDTQIRIQGPVIQEIRASFDRIEKRVKHHKRSGAAKRPLPNGEFEYLQSSPLLSWYFIYSELIKAIKPAQNYIYISTPFFAPNRRFRRLLRNAARRGVDVRLIVPTHSDVTLADWVFLSYARRLIKAKVRIFRYEDSVIHNKIVIADDTWATVGSTNMDVLSFFKNRESNIIIRNKDAIAELKSQFMNDLENCTELTLDQLAGFSQGKILIGYCARFFKSFFWRE